MKKYNIVEQTLVRNYKGWLVYRDSETSYKAFKNDVRLSANSEKLILEMIDMRPENPHLFGN